jgi:hypothetical protein
MTQSVCSRCIKPLSEAEKRRQTMLCTLCEPAWEMAFENKMHELSPLLHDELADSRQPSAHAVEQSPHK